MIAAIALRLAGPGAVLASRPTGVPHVYVGPLTRSGRSLPRASRPVCRARTRRLTVLVLDGVATGRVCARCAVCLLSRGGRQTAPTDRRDWQTRFAGITGEQLVAALDDARTPAEADVAAWASLLVYGVAGCRRPHPTTGVSLHDHVTRTRRRFLTDDPTATRLGDAVADAHHRRRAERQAAREDRDARIARIGIRNVSR